MWINETCSHNSTMHCIYSWNHPKKFDRQTVTKNLTEILNPLQLNELRPFSGFHSFLYKFTVRTQTAKLPEIDGHAVTSYLACFFENACGWTWRNMDIVAKTCFCSASISPNYMLLNTLLCSRYTLKIIKKDKKKPKQHPYGTTVVKWDTGYRIL